MGRLGDEGRDPLAALLRRFGRRLATAGAPGDASGARPSPARDEPAPTAFEQVTRRGLEDLAREVERLELKINAILVAVASTLLVELVKAVIH